MPASSTALAGRIDTASSASQRAGAVSLFYWPAVALVALLPLLGISLDHPTVAAAALAMIIVGGLPHGGFDLALGHRLWSLGGWRLSGFFALYVAGAAAMLALWTVAPLLALTLFLLISAVHFGDDWAELPDGLLRVCAGAAVIVAPAIGQPGAVADLFIALAGPDAIWLARAAIATAPVVLLVTLVAIAIAWRLGERQRAAALAAALLILLITPPLIGFALFFALLHAPRHMVGVRQRLGAGGTWTVLSGAGLALLSLVLWWAVDQIPWTTGGLALAASAFKLLSVLAAPHLVCSHAIDAWCARNTAANPARRRR